MFCLFCFILFSFTSWFSSSLNDALRSHVRWNASGHIKPQLRYSCLLNWIASNMHVDIRIEVGRCTWGGSKRNGLNCAYWMINKLFFEFGIETLYVGICCCLDMAWSQRSGRQRGSESYLICMYCMGNYSYIHHWLYWEKVDSSVCYPAEGMGSYPEQTYKRNS